MIARIPRPRLLPATICVLIAVLAVKSTLLVRTIIASGQPAALISAAWATGPDASPSAQKPPEQNPQGQNSQGQNSQGQNPQGQNSQGQNQTAKPERAAGMQPVGAVPPKASDKPATTDDPPPVTDAERAVLLELRDRRKELDAREASLAARESMLTAAETKLSERIAELQGLQKKLEALDSNHRQQEDAAWQGLVKVYETMKPRDAATIFNDLGMQVLLAVVDRMKDAKAAAILAAMTPDKAREVTMQLALSRSRAAGAVATGDKPAGPSEPGPSEPGPSGPGKSPGSGT